MPARLLTAVVLALALAACKTTPRACEKMKTLCDTELETCTGMRDSIRERLGADAVDKFDGCYLQASTCPEASGCIAGAAINATTDAAKSFLDGLGKELHQKK